jgi:sugar phosphate permease
MSIAMNMAINNLGAFLSPSFTKLTKLIMHNESASGRYLLVGIIAMVVMIILFIILEKPKKKEIELS